jgi:hypothetical protein
VLALGSFAAVDLPATAAVIVAVEHHSVDQALVSFLVSFAYVRNRSTRITEDGQPRSQTLLNRDGRMPTDLESVLGTT